VHLAAKLSLIAVFVIWTGYAATAEGNLIEDFKLQPETRWRFIADTVMGGISNGQVDFVREDGDVHAHMTGSGMPPVKWSMTWDSFIPHFGGPKHGKKRQAGRDRIEVAAG
jgi:hypothetical protein